LQHQPTASQDASRQTNIHGIQIPSARVKRLNDVRRDDVIALAGQQQVISSIVDAQPHVRPLQDATVNV
jgi:hypothetical protein